MVQVKDLTETTLRDLWQEVKEPDGWWDEVDRHVLSGVKQLLESAMNQELLDQLRAGWYHRTEVRRGYRNGYRTRSLLTQYGLIPELRVPRDREGQYDPKVLARYQRRRTTVDLAIREMFLLGISTRKVRTALVPLLGSGVSAQTVSRIGRGLDGAVAAFHRRPLVDHYCYLLLDGIVLKMKAANGAKRRLVLCTYGITDAGERELLAFRQAPSEAAVHWESFLRDLYDRGLMGRHLRLVTTDGGAGAHHALDLVYPTVPRQRCWAHKLRNVAAALPRKHQEECLLQAKTIYQAETAREARARFRSWKAAWEERAPKGVACLERDLDTLVPFLACPEDHWRRIRTTNPIERAFREVRRRTRPMTCFENSSSVDRIIYGVITHLNQSWKATPLLGFTHNT
jgi:transposase-like protein